MSVRGHTFYEEYIYIYVYCLFLVSLLRVLGVHSNPEVYHVVEGFNSQEGFANGNIWQAPKANFQPGIGATDLFAEPVYRFGLQASSIDLAMRRASVKNNGFSLTPTYGKMTQTWRLEELLWSPDVTWMPDDPKPLWNSTEARRWKALNRFYGWYPSSGMGLGPSPPYESQHVLLHVTVVYQVFVTI